VTVDFFDEDYLRLIAPLHPEAETRREVAALRELVALSQDDRILDVGCGWGRHLRLLLAAGHEAVGVDRSHALLRRSRGLGALLAAADMRALPFRDQAFDVVVNLATSLGLFLDDADAVAALAEARRVLRPGGALVIETMHRDDVLAHYAARDAWTADDGTAVRVRRRLDSRRAVSHEVLRWSGPAGAGVKRHTLRLRSPAELERAVAAAGFGVRAVYGGWDGEPLDRSAERVIVLARAPEP
jgi:SAM-dependent methyltransferase